MRSPSVRLRTRRALLLLAVSFVLLGVPACFVELDRPAPSDAGDASALDSDAPESPPPTYGGPSRCDAGAFVFCDGFEQGLGAWTQSADGDGGGTVAVDSTHVARGEFAFHSKLSPVGTAGATMRAYLSHGQAWPQRISVRFFVYLSPSGAHASVTNVLNLNDTTPSIGTTIFLTGSAAGDIAIDTFGVPNAMFNHVGVLPQNEWACLELAVDGMNAQVWMNDTPIVTIGFVADVPNILVGLGLNFVGGKTGDGEYDAWFDELAIAGDHIGCNR